MLFFNVSFQILVFVFQVFDLGGVDLLLDFWVSLVVVTVAIFVVIEVVATVIVVEVVALSEVIILEIVWGEVLELLLQHVSEYEIKGLLLLGLKINSHDGTCHKGREESDFHPLFFL